MNSMTAGPRLTALALTLGIGAVLALAAAPEAKAFVVMPTNGAAACKATNLAGQSAFYVSNLYLWNSSTSNQYLTCFMPTWNLGYGVNTFSTQFWWTAGATGGSVTCTAQSGYYAGSNLVAQGNTQTLTLAANAHSYIDFPALSRPSYVYSVNMICNVPPGFKLGVIVPVDNDPPSGYGWVP